MLKKFIYYLNPLTLFKKNEHNVNLKMMHGMNRISIFMFIVCIVVVIYKLLTR